MSCCSAPVVSPSASRALAAVVRPAALGGAAVGYGVVLLYVAVIIPPTFECLANGRGSASSQRWDRGESMSISTTGLVSGRSQY